MRPGRLILLVVLGLISPLVPTVAAQPSDSETIRRLILQLGSAKFAQREAATRALEALGPPALPALRRASQGSEAEVRRRAATVLLKIQHALEVSQCLAPKRIRLVYKNASVLDAVVDFADRSGCPLQILGDRAALAARRITLDTGEVPFWEAFDRFCRAAGLAERPIAPQALQSLRLVPGAAGNQILLGPPLSRFPVLSNDRDERFYLEDGKASALPTFVTGAVRLRALPAATARGAGEAGFLLEATPEFKIPWEGFANLRIKRALDDRGQDLMQGEPLTLDLPDAADGAIWQPATRQLLTPLRNARFLPVRLRAGQGASRVLRNVQGTLGARVQLREALLTVDDVLQAAGQTIKGVEGATLKVEAVTRQEGGVLQLRVSWQPPPLSDAIRLGHVVRRSGLVVFTGARLLSPANVQVVDAHGKPFASVEVAALPIRADDPATPYQITCRPHPGQGEAAQLLYTGLRNTTIEMPFQLHDVPLQ